MNEQGAGAFQLDAFLNRAREIAANDKRLATLPQFYVLPARNVNFTGGNPYFFPYSAQPLYSTAVPLIWTIQVASTAAVSFQIGRVSVENSADSSCVMVRPIFRKMCRFPQKNLCRSRCRIT